MSSTRNVDSVTNAQGEHRPRAPRDEPLTTKGHAPGVMVGNDAVPTFSAKTLPAGSAPADRTFQPNPVSETPGQAGNEATLRSHGKESTYTSAESTLGGATSGDVHQGMGKPLSGQTAADKRHEGASSGIPGTTDSELSMADERIDPRQRALERETGDLSGQKDQMSKGISAEDRVPESADTVAAGRD